MRQIYTEKAQLIIRIIALFSLILLLGVNINILIFESESFYESISTFVINTVVMGLFLILFLFPIKLEILAFVCLIYSFTCFIIGPGTEGNPMGVLMFFLCACIFYSRGFFNKRKKLIKAIICVVYLLLVVFSLIRVKMNYVLTMINYIGYSLICILIIFFIRSYFFDVAENENLKILNLYHYKGLTNRDAQWLNLILEKTKYSAIAINDNMSIGAVKNRIGYIFNVLEVGDKIGFMNKYYGYKIIYVNPKEVL